MKKIPLNKGKAALVDDADYEVIKSYTWFFSDLGYAKTTIWKNNKATQLRMHHMINGKTKKGEYTDHINGNKLDNRRENLRICTNAENMRNRPAPSSNTSGYKGVTWHKQRNRWAARIKVFYKSIHLGLFDSKKDAAKAYNMAAKKHFGKYAYLNKIIALTFLCVSIPLSANAQLTVPAGGTGTSSVPNNYVLMGSSNSLRLTARATSTLGLESELTFTSPLSRTGNAISFLFNTVNTWTARNNFSNATSSLFTISSNWWVPQTSAILLTGSGGLVASYAGTSCTNQFPRSLSALGAATCASVANTDLTNSSVTYNGTTVALGASGTITAASSSILSDTNTFSTTATTTFLGNIKVKNIEMTGNFYGVVSVVSSGNVTVGGNLAVTGTTNLTGLLTMVNASSTNMTASQSLFAQGNRVSGERYISNKIASSTAYTGTSSVTSVYGDTVRFYFPYTGTITSYYFGTDTGTLTVKITCGSNTVYVFASSTANLNTTSLACTKGDLTTIIGGNPASTPTLAAFTLIGTGY